MPAVSYSCALSLNLSKNVSTTTLCALCTQIIRPAILKRQKQQKNVAMERKKKKNFFIENEIKCRYNENSENEFIMQLKMKNKNGKN